MSTHTVNDKEVAHDDDTATGLYKWIAADLRELGASSETLSRLERLYKAAPPKGESTMIEMKDKSFYWRNAFVQGAHLVDLLAKEDLVDEADVIDFNAGNDMADGALRRIVNLELGGHVAIGDEVLIRVRLGMCERMGS